MKYVLAQSVSLCADLEKRYEIQEHLHSAACKHVLTLIKWNGLHLLYSKATRSQEICLVSIEVEQHIQLSRFLQSSGGRWGWGWMVFYSAHNASSFMLCCVPIYFLLVVLCCFIKEP